MKRFDQDTTERVLEQYGDTIYRLALHYVKEPADAEDVVHKGRTLFSSPAYAERKRSGERI